MKFMKTMAFLTAASILGSACSVSCSLKKNADDKTPDEPVIMEYSTIGADSVNVPITVTDSAPPVELCSIEIPEISGLPINNRDCIEKRMCDYIITEEHVYFCVSDYTTCGYVIYDYNLNSGEIAELCTLDFGSINVLFSYNNCMQIIESNLYIICDIFTKNTESRKMAIISIDVNTGETEEIWSKETDNYFSPGLYAWDGKLIVTKALENYVECGYQKINCINADAYDPESGEWTVLAENVPWSGTGGPCYPGGIMCSMAVNSETEEITLSAEGMYNIELDKDMHEYYLLDADESFVSWINLRNSRVWCVKYVFDENRIYNIETATVGSNIVPVGGNFLTGDSRICYIIAELGLAFPLTEYGDYYGLQFKNGYASFYGGDFEREHNTLFWFRVDE